MSEEFAARVAGVGALAEPARRQLYLYVAAQTEAVSREQAAAGVGVPLHSAKFHLDRLVDEGLLEVEFRRLSGRSGPGAGRPSKLYRRSAREVSVSLPERRYDLAGHVLARAVDRAASSDVTLADAVRESAETEGRRIAASAATAEGDGLTRTSEVLVGCGYEPRLVNGEICLANCPFDSLAQEHTALVCGMNLALIDGVVEEIGAEDLSPRLEPEPGLCCVKVGPSSGAA